MKGVLWATDLMASRPASFLILILVTSVNQPDPQFFLMPICVKYQQVPVEMPPIIVVNP